MVNTIKFTSGRVNFNLVLRAKTIASWNNEKCLFDIWLPCIKLANFSFWLWIFEQQLSKRQLMPSKMIEQLPRKQIDCRFLLSLCSLSTLYTVYKLFTQIQRFRVCSHLKSLRALCCSSFSVLSIANCTTQMPGVFFVSRLHENRSCKLYYLLTFM